MQKGGRSLSLAPARFSVFRYPLCGGNPLATPPLVQKESPFLTNYGDINKFQNSHYIQIYYPYFFPLLLCNNIHHSLLQE